MNQQEIRVEVINPSDPISMDVSDHEAAALAMVLVGAGQYWTEADKDGFLIPAFIFYGEDDRKEWWVGQFGHEMSRDQVGDKRLVSALRSFHLDAKERSSVNNIVGYAHRIADEIEGKPTDVIPAPMSVFFVGERKEAKS